METAMFVLYGALACGGALGVVLSQNVVRMAFYLVVALGSTAALFFLLDADFIGATQILIYVGGTVVLLIFGVMLTSSGPYAEMKTTPGELLQGGAVGLALLLVIIASVLSVDWTATQQSLVSHGLGAPAATGGFNSPEAGNTSRSIGTALLGMRFDQSGSTPPSHEHSHGPQRAEPTGYLLPFEIVSVHLLVVLVGAAYLARAKRRATGSNGVTT